MNDGVLWQKIVRDNEEHAGVLVSVCRTAGSVPREVGARMWWRSNALLGTIGGGQLEFQALKLAAQIASGESKTERFPLAARAGQCCGGTVWLYFEYLEARSLQMRQDRKIALDEQHLWHDNLPKATTPLYLFGLGHVGAAIVKLSDFLPCPMVSHDERTDTETDALSLIKQAPAASKYLIMTHSHALDLALCEAILKRGDAAYCGLIGSASKRAQFIAKLQAKQLNTAALTCPIGGQSLSKIPEHIAIAVVHEIITLHAQPIH